MSYEDVSLLRAALNYSDALGYVNVANFMLLVYDVSITMEAEVEFIWKSPWSAIKIVYFLTRYTAFIDGCLAILTGSLYAPSERACSRVFTSLQFVYMIGLAIGDLVLTARAWAFWRTTKHITIILSLFWTTTWSTQIILIGINHGSFKFGVQNLVADAHRRGCILTSVNATITFACFSILLVYDGFMTLLMVLQVYLSSLRHSSDTGVLHIIVRDGIIFYICVLACSVANMIVIMKFPAGLNGIIVPLTRTFHSILTCRAILHARRQAYKDDHDGVHFDSSISPLVP